MLSEHQLSQALAGRYAVDREIGAGGMATVYLARDLRHDRQVALKVLKPELGAVLGVERFLSEIQVTAKLQHPNLLPLFDSGEGNGLLYYVMPFVDGETLRARLDREKQLPIDDVVRIATAIASALDYAHQHGVIHRDLKPENILLQSGQPMIADFGIALAVSNAGGARITQTGLSLGTPQYMSPEQAAGDRMLDGRTDIYSLGAVTYEMLVGDPPHWGGTAQAIIAKVLTERPPSVRVGRPSVREEVAWGVDRALEKLPADRWSSAREFAEALQGKVATRDTRVRPADARTLTTRTRLLTLLASMATVALAVASFYFGTRRAASTEFGRFDILLPESVSVYSRAGTTILALSRDGSQLVVLGERLGHRSLYLRRMRDQAAQLVRGSDSAFAPSFSPDGRWLLYKVGDALKKLPVVGGTAQTLSVSIGTSASWGDDGRVVFDREDGLWLGSSDGRDARLIAKVDPVRHIYGFRWPEVLPGGRHVLVTIDRSSVGSLLDSLELGLVSLTDGTVTDLGVAGTNPHYAKPGRIVFGRTGGLLFSAPFSLQSRTVTGPPELIVDNVWQAGSGATGFTVSQTGMLAIHTADLTRQLAIVDRSGTERIVSGDAAFFLAPRVSPDGRHVAVAIRDVGSGFSYGIRGTDVATIVDLSTGTRVRLTPESTSTRPEWTRDGSRVVFLRALGGPIFSRPWDQNGAQLLLSKGFEDLIDVAVGPTGGYWAMRRGVMPHADIVIAPADSLANIRPFVATAAAEVSPRVSPNGRLLAYQSNESSRDEVYLQPLPGPGPRIRVSVAGGQEPIWSADGSVVFYRGAARIMAATIAERPALAVVRRDSLFLDRYSRSAGFANYDVFGNGSAFLMVTEPKVHENKVSILINWMQR